MRRFKGNLLSVGKPLKFETSSSKIQILKLSTQGVASAIPISVPYAPKDVSASEPGNSQARVTWTAPEKNGGSVITSYIVTCSLGFTQAVSGSLTTTIFTGLTNGTTYTFTVQAINVAGASIASSPSNSVIPVSVPGAPISVSATRGNAQATLSWTAPSNNGGSTIIMYRVISNNNIIKDVSGTLTTTIVSGLTNGTSYTFTVQAINIVGASIPSSPSNLVTLISILSFLLAEVQLTTPSLDPTVSGSSYGTNVAISSDGNLICVSNSGATTSPFYVKIYRYNTSNATWNNEKTITTSYANISESFEQTALQYTGYGLAISGNNNYIGISNHRSAIFGSNAGLVEVYEYNVSTSLWSRNNWLNSILTPYYNGTGSAPAVSNEFWGNALSFNNNGNVLAVGSFTNPAGSIKIYKQNNSVWTQTSIITNGLRIGGRISLSGNGNILVADSLSAVLTFIESQTNSWSIFPSPSPEIINTGASGYPAIKLSKDGTTFIVGINRYNGPLGTFQGLVIVYRFLNNSWTPIGQQLPGKAEFSAFGTSVAISENGNIILVGSSAPGTGGIVYAYKYNSTINYWDELFYINGQNATELFSQVLDITSDATKLVFGIRNIGSGLVRIYDVAYDSSVIP